ncbi:MAG: SIS domain-containing protein [Magnetospirillum sp.]|nr:SIS domain-containing protein [Magnetospirillum sp.]
MATAQPGGWPPVIAALDRLAGEFLPLNGFSVHAEIAGRAEARALFASIAASLGALRQRAEDEIAAQGRTDLVEQAKERLSDYLWQVETEVLGNVGRVGRLLPVPFGQADRASHFLAWSVEAVLQGLDKLEVRGRDSAGIGIALELDGDAPVEAALAPELRAELTRRLALDEAAATQMLVQRTAEGRWAVRATYKVANLVGRLGENGAALRSVINGDDLLWAIAPRLKAVSIISHTRWASNGLINVPNCHPIDGRITRDGIEGENGDACASSFVLNGDVDNYPTLLATSVQSRGLAINPAVNTDAKILPVVFSLDTPLDDPLDSRFLGVMRRCQGSFAIILQHLGHPRRLMVGQKGSGQALYIGQVPDGFVVASEVYGIAALCRSYWPMNAGGDLGVAVELDARGNPRFSGHTLAGSAAWTPAPEAIQIFARDIFRGDFPTYIEKEVSEAPASVRKTLAGKYRKEEGRVRFLVQGFGNGELLMRRLVSRDQPPVRRIIVCGQGTAAVAAMGVAHLIRRAVAPAGIAVEAGKASELFGFMADGRFDDAMVVAVSQSGTTTDTNRIVDLAKARGAWIHAIVNRRNSALVQKAHSFLYTSDGRDVEMSVASTKAYYSQVTAGKLLGLLLANQLGTLNERQILDDVEALEALPGCIQTVLDRREQVAAMAARTAPYTRNWAIVGNGANRIAAEEIRIKLSELCYKGIPCDVTEDKKHIDLSTEPLTIVVANDLPEMVVSDTVKEVSIFKAHNGRPLVLCAEGEDRFDPVAEATFALPTVGGGLNFVVATVAGHLFGIAAAQAIDHSCLPFRDVRAILSRGTDGFAKAELAAALDRAIATVETGVTDSALSARLIASLARYHAWLERQPDALAPAEARLDQLRSTLNAVIDDLTRPIDTIRHQAKTVTVGISRPQQEVSPLILDVLANLEVPFSRIADRDREMLEMLSPLVTEVQGAVVYDVTGRGEDPAHPAWDIQAARGVGNSSVEKSRYRTPRLAEGSKRKALRTGAAVTASGSHGTESLVVVPLHAPSGNAVSGLLLLHVGMTPKASLQQKVAVLRAINHKYDELTEHLAEKFPHVPADRLLSDLDPRTLIFGSVHDILTRFRPA